MDFAATRRIAAIEAAREAFLVLGRRCHALQGSETSRSFYGLGDGCGHGYTKFEERLHRPGNQGNLDQRDGEEAQRDGAGGITAAASPESPEMVAMLLEAEQCLMAWKRAQIFGGLPPAKKDAQALLEQLRSLSRRGGSERQRQLMQALSFNPKQPVCRGRNFTHLRQRHAFVYFLKLLMNTRVGARRIQRPS